MFKYQRTVNACGRLTALNQANVSVNNAQRGHGQSLLAVRLDTIQSDNHSPVDSFLIRLAVHALTFAVGPECAGAYQGRSVTCTKHPQHVWHRTKFVLSYCGCRCCCARTPSKNSLSHCIYSRSLSYLLPFPLTPFLYPLPSIAHQLSFSVFFSTAEQA